MAKTLLTFKSQCFNATKGQNGTSLQFARQVEQTEQGPAAREVIIINVKDKTLANNIEVMGKEYTITVAE